MSNYKNFTQYNEEAENIRPTARIQLIQRILNAASLISSLGQGVPLRWAQSYKAFQVLKYSENSDPEDVTSSNAVSAVDSILHEAEAQLKASYDDLEALKLELQKMPLNGSVDWTAYPHVPVNTYIRVINVVIGSTGYNICFHSGSDGSIDKKIYIMNNTAWSGISSKIDLIGTLNWVGIFTSVQLADGGFVKTARLVNNDASYVDITFNSYHTSSGVNQWTANIVDYKLIDDSNVQENKYSWISPVSSIIFPSGDETVVINIPLVTGVAVTQFSGQVGRYPSMMITGSIDTDDSLGLPDPSNLIDILDHLTD